MFVMYTGVEYYIRLSNMCININTFSRSIVIAWKKRVRIIEFNCYRYKSTGILSEISGQRSFFSSFEILRLLRKFIRACLHELFKCPFIAPILKFLLHTACHFSAPCRRSLNVHFSTTYIYVATAPICVIFVSLSSSGLRCRRTWRRKRPLCSIAVIYSART